MDRHVFRFRQKTHIRFRVPDLSPSVESLPVTYSWVLAPFRVRLLAVKPMYRYSIAIKYITASSGFQQKNVFFFHLDK